ncbi:MAG: bifunctional oligoribonuclease/PAP phosphatase NrnA, partial [Pirellulaceae bacterium]|nr:bifunctional oligoribonuclease/PAP phosphatase NrnA [Pirellulaceae bacterium]
DHHLSSDDLGAEAFKNVQAEATGRLVMEAAEHLGVQLTEKMATPLYAAIATDTGWYRFPSTTSQTYRFAAQLIDAGAKPAAIYNALYEQDTLGRMKLRGAILSRILVELEGRLAYTHVLLEDFEKTGSLPSDTEDAINMLLAIAGTQVAVIFVELPGKAFKISFRSRSSVDFSKLAEQFAGGGHKAAAGATMTGSLADVQPRVLDAVRVAMR